MRIDRVVEAERKPRGEPPRARVVEVICVPVGREAPLVKRVALCRLCALVIPDAALLNPLLLREPSAGNQAGRREQKEEVRQEAP